MSRNMAPMGFFVSFIVSNTILKSLIHLEMIFTYDEIQVNNYIPLQVSSSFFQEHAYVQETTIPHPIHIICSMHLAIFQNNSLTVDDSDSYSNPLDFAVGFMPIGFSHCVFMVCFEVKLFDACSFILFTQECLRYLASFVNPYDFVFSFIKNCGFFHNHLKYKI